MFLAIVIDLDPNIFRLGPLLITWHGVFSVLGIIAAARLGFWLLKKDIPDLKDTGDGLAWMVALGLVGARALYVWENWRIFANGQWLRVFALTEGGISQWGGLFGALVGIYVWSRRTHYSFWKIVDAGGAATMIGLAVGRIGDVINGEHHGSPTTAPWGVEYVNQYTLGQPGRIVHPEVAYEMVLTLAILAAILPFHLRLKRVLPDGVIGLIYVGIYAIGRFWLSFFRLDMEIVFGLRQAQIASLIMVAFAVIAIPILFRLRSGRAALAAPAAPAAPAPAIEDRVESTREPAHEMPELPSVRQSRLARRRRRTADADESTPPTPAPPAEPEATSPRPSPPTHRRDRGSPGTRRRRTTTGAEIPPPPVDPEQSAESRADPDSSGASVETAEEPDPASPPESQSAG